ncbi:helix-turn-helix domain-containing protein [Pseudodesulfovibrio indicus]|uniref:IclR family transcriptional regulator n=1 Tax=Pseudodesulfovibrio indicus TaxID=1716143 RepID=A0A140D8W1_9BACT|nr:helix-turn-helix domain-containing protein [Pseudodesulfovibrio indicus]AMK09628.1 IclR family transcriptional regulator [Pseudodesulfovibrio indicus]TDT86424.1 IclR-like helix-turn-helix domain-containing protein [Pseudodesulfovibrio indicus]
MAKSTSSRRVLRVLALLKGHTLDGLANGEIAQALDETPVNISRALAVLAEEGWVTQLPSGRYAHHISVLQLAQAHANEMDRASSRIREINQRVMAGAHN